MGLKSKIKAGIKMKFQPDHSGILVSDVVKCSAIIFGLSITPIYKVLDHISYYRKETLEVQHPLLDDPECKNQLYAHSIIL